MNEENYSLIIQHQQEQYENMIMKSQEKTTKDNLTLLPCPFCGGEPYLAKRVLQYDTDSDPVTWYGYGCKLCKVQFGCYNDTIEQAREQWNRRVGE